MTDTLLAGPLSHLERGDQVTKGARSSRVSVCASVCMSTGGSELPCGQTAIECPIPAGQVVLPGGVRSNSNLLSTASDFLTRWENLKLPYIDFLSCPTETNATPYIIYHIMYHIIYSKYILSGSQSNTSIHAQANALSYGL